MDLFDFNNNEETAKPLAERMRANNLDEFIGQKHIVSEHSLLRRAIATDKLGSCIFWGPPAAARRRSPISSRYARTGSLSSSTPSIRAWRT